MRTASAIGRDSVFRRSLVLADVLAAFVAVVLCTAVVGNDSLRPMSVLALVMVVVVSKIIGLYDRDEHLLHKATLDEMPSLFQVATLYALLFWLAQAQLIEGDLSRSQVAGIWGALFVLLAICRVLARHLAQRVAANERCLFIGDEPTFTWLSRKIGESDKIGAEVIGLLRITPDLDEATVREALIELSVDRVVLAPSASSDTDETLGLISAIKDLGVGVSIVPRMFEVVGSSVEFDDVDGVTVLGVRRFGLTKSSHLVKRAFDLAGAGMIALLLSPLGLLIAVLVRLDSDGPIFFRQTRIGRNGRPFEMLKFRSMVDGAEGQKARLGHLNEAQGLFKITHDPRITRIGRFLRKTSMDELPQLINVLRGEMSLVGPRPLVREDDRQVQGRHRRRLHLTPGMTGPWQVLGSSRIPLREMVTIDYLYVANWSLWADVKILLRTVSHVATASGR